MPNLNSDADENAPAAEKPVAKNPVDAVKDATKAVIGNHELSKSLDDEMQRPPEDRSPLT